MISKLKEFEYMIRTDYSGDIGKAQLNEFGTKGWELCGMSTLLSGCERWVFKRAVTRYHNTGPR